MNPLAPGSSVDRYTIVRLLGEGGMGAVYEARDPELARSVALKVIHEPDAHRSMRMLREAQALAQLQHPNVVAVHEVGTDGERFFIAMELVDGDTLDRGGPRRWREVVALMVQARRGLAAAHAKQLVHRDVKPSNILVGTDGRVRIGDFGLARRRGSDLAGDDVAPERARPAISDVTTVGDDESQRGDDAIAPVTGAGLLGLSLTGHGVYVGTPRYMAPEQRHRAPATARSDQFSFCVTAWELIHGEHPFDGEVRRRTRSSPAPRWLLRVLDRGLASDPSDRHPSMTELCDLLERTPRRRRAMALAAAGVATVGGVVAFALIWPGSAARPVVDCDRAGDAAAAVWTPALRDQVGARFAEVASFGPDAAERTQLQVDAWVERWRDARIGACRAHTRGEQSAAVLDRRMGCLDRELILARGVFAGLARGGAATVRNAHGSIAGMPSPESCAADRLQHAMPIPDDARVAAFDAERTALVAANLAGDLPEARRRSVALLAIAEQFGHPGLLADALLQASFHHLSADLKVAAAARERALALATEAGDPDLQALAAMRMLHAASVAVDPRSIEALLPIARAAVARPGVPPALRLDFLEDEATALHRLARFEEALAACERLAAAEVAPDVRATRCRCATALAQSDYASAQAHCAAALAAAQQVHGASSPHVTSHMNNLAQSWRRVGRYDEASALMTRAVEIEEAAYGPDSPEVADLLSAHGGLLGALGRYDEALPVLERNLAVTLRLDAAGPPSTSQGHAEMDLAELLVRMDRPDEALAHADRGLAIFEQVSTPGDPDLIRIYASHGNVYTQVERWEVVERSMSKCASLALALHGAHHPLRVICLLSLGQVRIAEGRAAEAVPDLEQAVAALTAMQASPFNVGTAHAILGRALGESGDRARARKHLDEAIATFIAVGPNGAENLAEARRQRRRFR